MEKEPKEFADLTEKQKQFCSEYIFDWNATRAYKKAYGTNDETSRINGCRLLTNANIKAYVERIQVDLEKEAGLSRLKVIKEWEKIAFNSIAHLHNSWVELKDFNTLSDEQKQAIESIETKTIKRNLGNNSDTSEEIEYVKIKLYSKEKALENIAKMLGYNASEKIDIKGEIKLQQLPNIVIE